MKKTLRLFMLGFALAVTLTFSRAALALQTPTAQDTKAAKSARPKAVVLPAASDKDIADAKAKGLVWVNTGTQVFHKDGQFYGKTKQGKFMSEADAVKAGYHAAKPPSTPKKAAQTAPKK